MVKKKATLLPADAGRLLAALPAPFAALLARIAALAQARQEALWLVGGVVRDIVLGLPLTRDLDVSLEGDAVALAEELAAALGGHVSARHQAFGTASVLLALSGEADREPSGLVLDLASTRSERYPQPAALPVVQPADIRRDLGRRDFTVNAMALEVPPPGTDAASARFLDPFAGLRDLQAGKLRVLHAASFQDDPTRILRGLRLAVRLGAAFEPHTRALLAATLEGGLLEQVGPDRLRTELCLALEEPDPLAVLQEADALGILAHIFPPLRAAPAAHAGAEISTHAEPLVRAGLLTYELSEADRAAFAERYRLPREAASLLQDVGSLRARRDALQQPGLRNSQLDDLLRPFGKLALDVVRYAETGPARAAITHYLDNLRDRAPLLDGHALQRLGVPPGPQLGALLRGLRAARLDGLLHTRADEEAWVLQQRASRES
jgi:tRNA nucleotidyltransferase (CCA-adding enzyme)